MIVVAIRTGYLQHSCVYRLLQQQFEISLRYVAMNLFRCAWIIPDLGNHLSGCLLSLLAILNRCQLDVTLHR